MLTVAGAVAIVGALATAAQGDGGAPGTLPLRAEVSISYPPADCPAGTPRLFECFARTGEAIVPGLGTV